ncbi:MAG: argininosuccinate synthase [Candidatus Jacksonbacteria bacterium RIFOXYC2_FULL_44_29]|nr:MAG: Argininosuccinate synthase [Parcubacteria group bacterium GW2011_GWC2_44_22]OGY75199.1 MAG: argininosuccinate synthase [Candidatus Jacksonbacteria bacterium RIFOXYA2_FULL_43_12]OGY75875.1 MAG: argininosuccinate synthase [Candidatus Jacksonbacteria bacterium RIFOXYB2_FULL_44_15]OGY77648.1 MAG: argininosuccinate synthase [Candidatus Jacksonbacteria bacterium RIFOXYC2_FULL_44_29]OGY79535.1 MAG: argininosuccinate synthase [Candidatus Jacksonbacteria bacterium RIFOXYD2_FULL_43_21]HBH46437.1
MRATNDYFKIASYEAKKGNVKKCVLLYSGGLDTSCMLKWIQDEYKCQVIALCLDVGQQADNLTAIKAKALKLGAIKSIVLDVKDECASEYIAKGIKANACYQGEYHLSTPIVRPLLAKKAVQIALKEGADAIAHGCTGKGNDQVRLDSAIITLAPKMKIIAPVRECALGRDEEIAYAKKNQIPIQQSLQKSYSYDDNMWGVTGEGGEIEDPKKIPLYDQIVTSMNLPEQAPDNAEIVEVEFARGLPVSINDQPLKLSDLIARLNQIGGQHGVGLVTLIEDRLVGLKVRGVYWAPAAHVIIIAHQNLEKLVSTREENEFKSLIDTKWAYLCYGAKWYDPLMDNLNAFIDQMNQKVSGQVKLKLYKGQVQVVAVESPNSLFDADLATFNKSAAFNQNASAGFIEIYNLAAKTAWAVKKYDVGREF